MYNRAEIPNFFEYHIIYYCHEGLCKICYTENTFTHIFEEGILHIETCPHVVERLTYRRNFSGMATVDIVLYQINFVIAIRIF